jgi:hypothetical protein
MIRFFLVVDALTGGALAVVGALTGGALAVVGALTGGALVVAFSDPPLPTPPHTAHRCR